MSPTADLCDPLPDYTARPVDMHNVRLYSTVTIHVRFMLYHDGFFLASAGLRPGVLYIFVCVSISQPLRRSWGCHGRLRVFITMFT